MRKRIMIGAFLVGVFMFVGCGGGNSGSSIPAIDNSGNLENQYGFFGDNVKFGNQYIVGSWFLSQRDINNYLPYIFYADGSARFNNHSADYGVNKNGTIIKTNGGDIIFNSIMYAYHEVTGIDGSKSTYDCFDVTATEGGATYSNITMCPAGL